MKKIIVLFTCMLATGLAFAACGPDSKDCKPGAGQRTDYAAVLNLTDSQKKPFKAMQDKHQEEHRQLRTANDDKRDEFRAQQQALRDKHMLEMKGFLTAEQFKKYEELMEKRKERRKEVIDDKRQDMQKMHGNHRMDSED